jgi:hypothetical protein
MFSAKINPISHDLKKYNFTFIYDYCRPTKIRNLK